MTPAVGTAPARRCRRLALALAVALVAAPAESAARVEVDPDRIVVDAGRARAIVERAPLRISFADDRGRTVLRQPLPEDRAPLVVPPLPDPLPPGTRPFRSPTRYEPLTYTVGAARRLQYPVAQFEGNLLAGIDAGTQYSAGDVIAVERAGSGVRLTASTDDPSGRRLVVTISPHGRRLVRVSVRPSPDAGVANVGGSFIARASEAFHGFGGRHNAIDQRGEDFLSWNEQQNVGAGFLAPVASAVPGSGGELYRFPGGPNTAYYAQAQFVSSAGYGLLVDRPELLRWRLASDRADAWQVSAAAPGLDVLVAPGRPRRAIRELTEIGGRHRVPPRWGIGPMLDRLTRYPNETPSSYRASVLEDLENIDRHRLPLTAYRVEGWEFLSRADLRRIIAELRDRGIRPLVYFRPFVGLDNIGTDDPDLFAHAIERGYVATTATGAPFVFVSNFNAPAALIDFTDPAAVAWWKQRVTDALRLGAEGFMQDFGEQVLIDMHFDDGSTGATMHNRYPVLYHRATRQAVRAFERRHKGRRTFFYTRTGYSGKPGSGAFENANFPGDETTDWSRASGLASLAPDMLSRAIGGLYGYGTDIGGYFDIGPYEATSKELFIRWAQWAALTPVMRLHGSVSAGTHTPWSYDDETARIYNRLSRLHLRARELIMHRWRVAERTGVPITIPLWLRYPSDPRAAREAQQWLLGPRVLVAPVVEQGARSREVYFPRGCWRDPVSGRRFEGPAAVRVAAPLSKLPYYFRCGTKPF